MLIPKQLGNDDRYMRQIKKNNVIRHSLRILWRLKNDRVIIQKRGILHSVSTANWLYIKGQGMERK